MGILQHRQRAGEDLAHPGSRLRDAGRAFGRVAHHGQAERRAQQGGRAENPEGATPAHPGHEHGEGRIGDEGAEHSHRGGERRDGPEALGRKPRGAELHRADEGDGGPGADDEAAGEEHR
jgi:hypothetical protein